jgi:hypothetical protein
MLSQMKRPRLGQLGMSGIGRRNDTVEAIRSELAMAQARKETAARVRAARPQAAPMDPSARHLIYAGKPTPKQARRMERKEASWHRRGLGVSKGVLPTAWEARDEPVTWDPTLCICATMNNPPCSHCETAVYDA